MGKGKNDRQSKRIVETMRVHGEDEMSPKEYFEFLKSQGYITVNELRKEFMRSLKEEFERRNGSNY